MISEPFCGIQIGAFLLVDAELLFKVGGPSMTFGPCMFLQLAQQTYGI
jgi:hypothetical protein